MFQDGTKRRILLEMVKESITYTLSNQHQPIIENKQSSIWKLHITYYTTPTLRLTYSRFQVLFHSFFKVLFIFPSRYLFTIGLLKIFSLRWCLPPTSSCNPKQLDSTKLFITQNIISVQGFHLLWLDFPVKFKNKLLIRKVLHTTIHLAMI